MASKAAATESTTKLQVPVAVIVAAWLVPGGGHLLQRRWGRGILLLATIGFLFVMGVALGGRFFHFNPSSIVETLGSLGNFCSGLLYFGARFAGYDPAPAAAPAADYGTKFLLVAGLLNVLCILDAYDIAVGNKP
ncbi:MAG TPA: DUF6677 family protein [Terriglobia bacterium]|nr:DUF6677 family protein [Terriglobia bacterium]